MNAAQKHALAQTQCVKLQPRIIALAVRLALSALLLPTMAYAQTQVTDDAKTDGSSLPEVVVKAQKPASNTKVITADDLTQAGVTDMAGVVDYEPLISAPSTVKGSGSIWDGSGTSGYNIRGVEGNRIALDVDGVELPASASQPNSTKANGSALGRDYVDPEMFRKIEITSGSTTADSGASGIGGRVAFVTKSPEDYLIGDKTSYYGAKFGYTSADKAWAEALTAASKIGDWQILGIYSRRDGEMAKPNDVSTPETDSWHSDALLMKLVYGGIAQHKIGLTIDMYDRKDSATGDTASANSAYYPYGAKQATTTSRHRLEVADEFTPTGGYLLFDKLRSYAYYQNAKKETNTIAEYTYSGDYMRYIDTYLETTSVGVGADLSKHWNNQDIYYGLSLNQIDEKRPWSETRYNATTGALVSGYPFTKAYMAPTKTTKLIAYVRDEWHLTSRATLTPGLRGEYWHTQPGDLTNYLAGLTDKTYANIKSSNTGFLSPSLNFTYALTPTYDFYSQYTHGVRVATAAEKTGTYDSTAYTGATTAYAIVGNQNLKNETSDSFELGTKGEIAHGTTVNASLFYTKYKNFIDYKLVSTGIYQVQNIANANIWGGEIMTRFDLGAYANVMQGYSVGVAAGVSEGTATNSSGKSSDVNSVGPAKGSIKLAYDDPNKRYGGGFIMTSVRNKQASNDDASVYSNGTHYMVPGYTTFDLSTYWKLAKNVTLNAGIYNLTDKKYWDYASVRALTTTGTYAQTLFNRAAQPGRNFAVTVNVSM